jgi:hypothetical protein
MHHETLEGKPEAGHEKTQDEEHYEKRYRHPVQQGNEQVRVLYLAFGAYLLLDRDFPFT